MTIYHTPKPLRNTPFSDSVRLEFNLTLFLFCNLSLEGHLAVTLLIGSYINEPRLTLTLTHPLRKENYNFNMLKEYTILKKGPSARTQLPLKIQIYLLYWHVFVT